MKILYVTTVGGTMTFFTEHLRMLLGEGHTVELACNNEASPVRQPVLNLGLKIHQIPFSRSPLSKDNFKAYAELKRLIAQGGYDIVHTHTPNASVVTRLACRKFRGRGLRVFYTAHGFHFYRGAPLRNWLLYYPVERLCARYTDVLITINHEDYELARKRMRAGKVVYVPGVGLDLSRFSDGTADPARKRRELGIPDGKVWVLSVGELSRRKNHEVMIRAIADMPDVYYTIAGTGDLLDELTALAARLGIGDRVRFLGFRDDISELCSASDVFALPSLQEGLPVALMEAMAAGRPVVCSRIRGNTDLMDEGGGRFFDPRSAEEARAALIGTLRGDRDLLGARNRVRIRAFGVDAVLKDMSEAYRGGYRHLVSLIRSLELRRILGCGPDDTMLLSVGELNRNKNHEAAVRVLAGLGDPRVHYVVAGEGDQRASLLRLARELGVSERTHLLGYRTDVPELYRAADIYLLPSVREGLNVSVMEAMAAGLPVVCGAIRGNTELIDDNGGALFAPDDLEGMRAALTRILRMAGAERAVMGLYNQRKIPRFGMDEVQRNLDAVYQAGGAVSLTALIRLLRRSEIRRGLGLSADDLMLLSVGELNRNKNHEVVLRALAEIRDPSLHYVIVGAGERRAYLAKLARRLGLSGQVRLTGFRSDIADLYRAADICCFPSVREGLGMAALEGMACGLPIIASDNRGSREYCADGENGYLCDPHDAGQFREAILRLRDWPETRRQMGLNSRQTVGKFGTDNVLRRMREIYGSVR